ncbi:pyrroline-5-carboxylate reductase [Ammonifex degensii KC4]|uniref:Pyrroline-5-carboxylate reductase n=1 Tax=Ammonifex degensii (strain DSM 10501 / KC4) TaxID=429009 RepID=C9RD23_AMMDK|nr:pyrroline-5-carboxylate reductase [Ammonifex degensii]ACX52150.1 pyrroline-5-carboxylate reductase [Ammonifex degensii KC4]
MQALAGLKVGFIGGGAMGGALATGLVRSGRVAPEQVLVSDVSAERLAELSRTLGIKTLSDNRSLAQEADIIVLAVKPDQVRPVLEEISDLVRPEQTLISIAAGVSLAELQSWAGKAVPVVRVMPNTPALVGEGASAYALGSHAGSRDAERTEALMSAVGRVVRVPKEELLDAVTGLSGSGPAYVYLVIEALAEGGVRMGLSWKEALLLAAQTVLGAAKMVLASEEHPSVLKGRVMTPAGTTVEGLFVLEDRGVRAAFIEAVKAAALRSKEMRLGKNEKGGKN